MEGAKIHRASGPSYTSLPATTKLDHLWSNCLRGSSEPAAPATPAEMLSWFMDPVAATMAGEGDELEEGRVKAIHRQGAVARVEWRDLGGHPYTGLLQVLFSPVTVQGCENGLLRWSFGLPPPANSQQTLPGVALKLMRDERESANVVFLDTTTVQDRSTLSLFTPHMYNHVTNTSLPCSSLPCPVKAKFSTGSMYIDQVSLVYSTLIGGFERRSTIHQHWVGGGESSFPIPPPPEAFALHPASPNHLPPAHRGYEGHH